MNQYKCRCLFDITNTGVTGHHKSSRVPFTDRSGQQIINENTWNRARNQQRNWETLTQLISLRTQIDNITDPVKTDKGWEFEFSTEADVYSTPDNPVGVLLSDVQNVPMLVILNTEEIMASELIISGDNQNIWFEQITVNN